MSMPGIFDSKITLPDVRLAAREKTLLGFEDRFKRVHDQLRLLLNLGELAAWSTTHHRRRLVICDLVTELYPLIVFHGDVGTGKTATAECIANRLAKYSRIDDSLLFKLSNRVRGSGKVGEMGSLLSQAFYDVIQAAGKTRRAVLLIDEGDSLAASRSQENSHHEDKVAVNTLIQCVDELRHFRGRVVVFLCTNRWSALDAALQRRAAVVEEFKRPDDDERCTLFKMDLEGLGFTECQINELVASTGPHGNRPGWTFSDIRTRLYPTAMAQAFPDSPLTFKRLHDLTVDMHPTPVLEDR